MITMYDGTQCQVSYAYMWRECGESFVRMFLTYPDRREITMVRPLCNL